MKGDFYGAEEGWHSPTEDWLWWPMAPESD